MDGGRRAAGEMFSCCWNTSNGHHTPINLVRGTPGAAQFPPGIVSYNQLAPVPAAPLEPRPARALADGRASSEPGQSAGGRSLITLLLSGETGNVDLVIQPGGATTNA